MKKTPNRDCVLALGCFDGVHLGHRRLLSRAAEIACDAGLRFAVWSLSSKGKDLLCTLEEREVLLRSLGAETVVFSEFSAIKDLTCQAFVLEYLQKTLHTAVAVCGENFRFGKNRAGDARTLQTLMRSQGGNAEILPLYYYGTQAVSSSRIRTALQEGNVSEAAALLGRPFSVTGTILPGKKLGRTLGFPTANQALPSSVVLPRPGVYFSLVRFPDGRAFPAVSNIGFRPTVEDASVPLCESCLLDFSGDLYGETLVTELLQFHRGEEAFRDAEALQKQVLSDLAAGRVYFGLSSPKILA